jgi:hypothetical protein
MAQMKTGKPLAFPLGGSHTEELIRLWWVAIVQQLTRLLPHLCLTTFCCFKCIYFLLLLFVVVMFLFLIVCCYLKCQFFIICSFYCN